MQILEDRSIIHLQHYHGAQIRLPLSPPRDDSTAGEESPAHYAQRMRALEGRSRGDGAGAAGGGAGGTDGVVMARLEAGRIDTVFKMGDRVLLWTKELLYAADIGMLHPWWNRPHCDRLP